MHQFIVANSDGTNRTAVNLTEGVALGILAILALPDVDRGTVIKALREMTTVASGSGVLGLYDAKQIVDFLAENGRIDRFKVVLSPPEQRVKYMGSGY